MLQICGSFQFQKVTLDQNSGKDLVGWTTRNLEEHLSWPRIANMYGKITILEPTADPAFLDGWSDEIRISELQNWIDGNFIPEDDFFFEFEDWENGDELEQEEGLEELDTMAVLDGVWKLYISDDERRRYAEAIDADKPIYWKPNYQRVLVEVDEDYLPDSSAPAPSIEKLQELVPSLLQSLENIEQLIPHQIGHNRPPDSLKIDRSEIAAVRKLLREFEQLEDNDYENDVTLLSRLGTISWEIGSRILKYAATKGDLFLTEATKSAGEQTGKWATRGVVLLAAGQGLYSFGEQILAVVGAK